ncbi:hypothetical protein EMPS_02874 [Entomortierella parvispora]|uniref:Uncharacterized protein n=1 Tax=Entomortierella parvispora TaxID=205924 RepID=A0A9P3LUC8_9FUNG|nr:hypothetical protein EMPS_02874 [Entomortierella parvispora]
MSVHKHLGRFRTRSLLGSVLLTLAILLAQQVSPSEGRVLLHARDSLYSTGNSNNYKRNDLRASVAMAAAEAERHEALWKRHQGHSPFTNKDSPPRASLAQGSQRKRSLFSHVNDDLPPPPEPERPSKELRASRDRQDRWSQQYHHDQQQQQPQPQRGQNTDGRDPPRPSFHEQEPENTDLWGEYESRTLIEPHYPSIDLFEEEDDDDDHPNINNDIHASNDRDYDDNNHHRMPSTVEDDEDEELLELGEDGVFRRAHQSRTSIHHHQQLQQQVWMVDEWEEDLESEMDELLDWAEDEELHLLERFERLQKSSKDMGSEDEQLRDQESSLRNFVLEDEDEASPFERIFSESWLF